MDISNSTAVVTGAALGIGRAIAAQLAADGASVLITDVDEEAGARTVHELRDAGASADFLRVDVSNDEDVHAAMEFARQRFGGLDVIVNNAGIAPRKDFLDATYHEWSKVVAVNLLGVMSGVHHGVRALRETGGGSILNVSSTAGVGLTPYGSPDYAGTKAAVNRLTAALAPLADSDAIRVNAVCPDWVDTPMVQDGLRRAREVGEDAETPDKLITPERIATATVDMIKDSSLSGRVLNCPVDGEWGLLPLA